MKFILLLTSFFTISTLACSSVDMPKEFNLAISSETQSRVYYNGLKLIEDKPQISVSNCLATAQSQQYLMFAIAIENFVLSNEYRVYSLNDELSTSVDECKIENSPFESQQTWDERKSRLFDKRAFINECVVYQVTDTSAAGISYPENQPGCTINKLSKNSVDFVGEYCYFSPQADSEFSFHAEVNPSCYNLDYLKEKNIRPQDVLGTLSLYKSGDASGRSPDLTTLRQANFRFSFNALKSHMNVSDDYGSNQPVWPSSWIGANVHLGEVKIDGSLPKYDHLSIPFAADTRCESKCVDGLCSSPCDYSQPIVGEFTLYGEYNGKKEFLKTWYDGGVSPSQWQGMLHGVGIELPKEVIEEGKRYTIEAFFSEPELNFMMFDGRVEKMISLANNQILELNRRGGASVGEIPLITMIQSLQTIPVLEIIAGIEFDGNLFVNLKRALSSFQTYVNNSFWPPYYGDICHQDGNRCIKSGQGKINLQLEFTVGAKKENGKYEILDMKYKSRNDLYGKTQSDNYLPPRLSCESDSDEDDDLDLGDDFDF